MNLWSVIATAWNAIAPIVLMILLGYALKQKGFLTKSFAEVGNRLVFRFGIPAMLFVNIYEIQTLSNVNWKLTVYAALAGAAIFFMGMVSAVLTTDVPQRRGVIVQCAFRSNFAIIGLPLATMLGGEASMQVAAVISAVSIPMFNILAVISLTMFVEKENSLGARLKSVLLNILKNPLILGVVSGLICIGLREIQIRWFSEAVFSLKRDVGFAYSVLTQLKSLTTPLSLIVLGSQFEFSAVKGLRKEILVGTAWRTVLAPLFGIGLAIFLAARGVLVCGPYEIPALIALFGSPVAVSSAVMAASMKNDTQLAAQLVVWTSVVSIFTLFAQICILLYFGFILL